MRLVAKILGGLVAVLLVLVLVAGMGVYLFVTSDSLRARIENHLDAQSGRKSKIGQLSIAWGWSPVFRLDDVTLSNADWGKAPHMFEARRIELQLALWPLLRGHIVLPFLRLDDPRIFVERNDRDQSNWDFAQSPVAAGAVHQVEPETRAETPVIGRLEIAGGRVSYVDARRKLQLTGTALSAAGEAPGGPQQIRLALEGTLADQKLALRFTGGSALMLRDTSEPYPLDLSVDYGSTHLAVRGTVDDPLQFQGARVQLSLSGQDLADIFPLLGIPGPPTPPDRLTGALSREPGIWHLDKVAWHAGESDLAGGIAVDQRSKPGLVTANLVSDHLAFADLAPLIGAPPARQVDVSPEQRQTEQKLEARGELFPNVPMPLERLRAMNMDVALDARHVVAPDYLPVTALDMRVRVQDGQATVEPLDLTLGGGTVTSRMSIDARPEPPRATADLHYHDVDLGTFFRGSRYFDTTHGKLQGRIDLAGQGRSLAEIMGSANGDFVVGSTGGSVSALLVSLAGLQIADALLLYITGDDSIPIACAMGRLGLKNGVAHFDRTVVDTTKSVVHVDGTVSLADQAIRLQVTADPKRFSLLDLHGPVLIQGKLRNPAFSIGRIIPIPTPDFGTATDVPCGRRFQELLDAQR
jgi:uncharacterized protein involved in outer membrane biogenesis